jgi:hypothetical protein
MALRLAMRHIRQQMTMAKTNAAHELKSRDNMLPCGRSPLMQPNPTYFVSKLAG